LNAIKSNQQASIFALSVGRKRLAEHDLEGALSQFREAVRLDPSSAPARHALADALIRKGERAEARQHLEAARRLEAPAPREP
jgi:Flp pilus assembly protein TadD